MVNFDSVKSERDVLKKKLLLLTWLKQVVSGDFFVVGGSAMELYSFGKYESADIDLVTANAQEIKDVLLDNGFRLDGRYCISDEIGVFIEIPGSVLAGDPTRAQAFSVNDNTQPFKVIGIEDLIIDRLNACVHWSSQTDCEWSMFLIGKYTEQIDMDYLYRQAKKESLDTKLDELLSLAKSSGIGGPSL